MAGWRKGDQSHKKESLDASREKAAEPVVSSNSNNANSDAAANSGWRKTEKSTVRGTTGPSQARWKKSEAADSGKRVKSYRGIALVLSGLLLLAAGIIFWDKLFDSDRALHVVLFQTNTEKSQVMETSLLLQAQAKQWSSYSSRNWSTQQFEDFKAESSDAAFPVLFHIQAQVASDATEKQIETLLRQCVEKIKPSGTAVVLLDLIADVRTLKLVDYEHPQQSVGQFWNFGDEIENAWKKVTDDQGVKDSKKNLVVLTTSITKDSEGEQNWIAPEIGGSVLQNFAMEALCTTKVDKNKVDKDGDRWITIGEFGDYIDKKIADWVKTRRSSFITTKLLVNNSALLNKRLLGLYVDPETEYQSPDALDELKKNWSIIEPLWSKYENLLQRKAYRWAPERLARIQQGLVVLDHLAERASLQQIEANKILKTVQYEMEACPDKGPAAIEADLLKLPSRLESLDVAKLEMLTTWKDGKPIFLSGSSRSVEASQPDNPEVSSETASKENNVDAKETPKSVGQEAGESSDSLPKYSANELALLTWESLKKFPESASPEHLKDLLDEVLPKLGNQASTLQIHFLKLLRYDSYLFKSTSDIDSSLKSRISATIGRSIGVLQRWIDLVYSDRRPDVVLMHSEGLDRITVDVQNMIVDAWLAGVVPEDTTLSELEGRLTFEVKKCEAWEEALDFRDLYLLQRPYYVRWLIATFPYADAAQQKALRSMVDNLAEVDLTLSDLQRIDENKLLSAGRKLVTDYRELVSEMLPDETSIPSEKRFCWLRLIASNPIELNAANRIRIREKLLQFLESGKQLRIGKGESELAKATKLSGESGMQLRQFIADLRGKIPEELFQRGKESPAENSGGTWQQIAWLRKLKALTFGDKYEQPSEASGAGDGGDDVWKKQVFEQSQWLQKLALYRVVWGSGVDLLSFSESPEKSYFVQLAEKCRARLRDSDPGKEESEKDWFNQALVKEAIAVNQRWSIDFKDGAEKKFNPDDFGGVSKKQQYEFNLEYPSHSENVEVASGLGEPGAVPTWVSDSMVGEGIGSYRSQLKDATAFSLEIDPSKGFSGFVIGSFRGNRFPKSFKRLPESKEFTELRAKRKLSQAKIVVNGKNASILNVVFAVDYSGSMNAKAPSGEDKSGNRLQEALGILESQVEILEKDYLRTGVVREIKVGAIAFGGGIRAMPLVSLSDFRMNELRERKAQGWTPLYDAINSAFNLLNDAKEDEGCLVVVITDGIDTSSNKKYIGRSLDDLSETFKNNKNVHVLLLQAGSKESFVKEMQELDRENGSLEDYSNLYRSEWDKAEAGIKSLASKVEGRFVWRPSANINGKEMSEEIERILPRTVVEISGPLKLSKSAFSLKEKVIIPIESQESLVSSQNGESGWTVVVSQRKLGDADGKPREAKFGPFALWGEQEVILDLELSTMELSRTDAGNRLPEAQDMRAVSQWIAPKLLKDGVALDINLDFGRNKEFAVERPELIFAKIVSPETTYQGISDFWYEPGFKYHRARFSTLPESILGGVDLKKTLFALNAWTVRKAESLDKYFVGPISVAAAEKGTWETVQLGEAWANIAVPEVTVRRERIAGSEKHRVTLKLSGAEATKWYFCLIGNVWGEVNTKIGSDGSWVEKSYELSESESQKDQRAVLIREAQLDELSEANAEEKVVEKFEFLQIPVSDR